MVTLWVFWHFWQGIKRPGISAVCRDQILIITRRPYSSDVEMDRKSINLSIPAPLLFSDKLTGWTAIDPEQLYW